MSFYRLWVRCYSQHTSCSALFVIVLHERARNRIKADKSRRHNLSIIIQNKTFVVGTTGGWILNVRDLHLIEIHRVRLLERALSLNTIKEKERSFSRDQCEKPIAHNPIYFTISFFSSLSLSLSFIVSIWKILLPITFTLYTILFTSHYRFLKLTI